MNTSQSPIYTRSSEKLLISSQNAGILHPFKINSKGPGAFTLVELITVMAVIVVMMSFLVPAFTGIQGGRDATKAAYDVAGALEQARTYAMANNTYVWVGFFEEDGSQLSTSPAATAGTGRVVMSVVASQNGKRYSDDTINATLPGAFGSTGLGNNVPLIQISKLIKMGNIHLASAANDNLSTGSRNNPVRPPVPTSYQVGNTLFNGHTNATVNPTTFTYPLKGAAQYTFVKIIEINSQGEASKIDENVFNGAGPQDRMEIALQTTHGNVVDPRYSTTTGPNVASVVQIEGITGQVQIFRP